MNLAVPTLPVLINKQKSKVLFAEANSDLADVLMSFLTFPLGIIVKIVKTQAPFGSISTLRTALSKLDSSHFFAEGATQMLLDPVSSFQQEYCRLKLDITNTLPCIQYFICEDNSCKKFKPCNMSMYSDIATCECGNPLNRQRCIFPKKCVAAVAGGVFTVEPSTFIVSDDLLVAPIAAGILLETLDKLAITDTEGAELMHLNLGIADIRKLFELCLFSATPLTDLVLKKGCYTTPKPETGILLHHAEEGVASSKKMVLKVIMQKSTNTFLFGEATDEFVEFLLSFLTIPLGGVVSLLGGNTCLKNIDNLYMSVTDLIDDKYFTSPDIKTRLVKPKVAHGYISQNQLLPLIEEGPLMLYYNLDGEGGVSFQLEYCTRRVEYFKSAKGEGNFVKKRSIFFVDDDLSLTPSLAESISLLNGKGIALSDLKEVESPIGKEEALSILRASLTSKTVLTDALIKPMLNKIHQR